MIQTDNDWLEYGDLPAPLKALSARSLEKLGKAGLMPAATRFSPRGGARWHRPAIERWLERKAAEVSFETAR
jgi:hypothetical protein